MSFLHNAATKFANDSASTLGRLGVRMQQARDEVEASQFTQDVGATLAQLGTRAQETRAGIEKLASFFWQSDVNQHHDVTGAMWTLSCMKPQESMLAIEDAHRGSEQRTHVVPHIDTALRMVSWSQYLADGQFEYHDSSELDTELAVTSNASAVECGAWLSVARGTFDGCWMQPCGAGVAIIVGDKLQWVTHGGHDVLQPLSSTSFSVELHGRTHVAELRGGNLVWDDSTLWTPAPVASESVALLPESDDLPSETCALIEGDVQRTFASNAEFQRSGGPDKLRRVLRRFAIANPDIGYCQSLNLIAAVFIVVFDHERVIPEAISRLIRKLETRQWYTEGTRQLRADTLVLGSLMQEAMPDIRDALRKRDIDLLCICPKWFLSLFSAVLEGEVLLQVWDAVLRDGIGILFRVALAIFRFHRAAILSDMPTSDALKLLSSTQDYVSADLLTAFMYDSAWSKISSVEELKRRRRSAIARVASSDGISELSEVAEAYRELHRC